MPDATTWYDRLDATARAALQHAHDQSERAGVAYVGTEHLLLGLVAQPRSPTRRMLRGFGLELESARAAFEQLRATASEHIHATAEHVAGLTPEAKRVIELAVARARALNAQSVGTEHLLVGLLDVESGAAIDFLRVRGVDLNALRATRTLTPRGARPPGRRMRVTGALDPLEEGVLLAAPPGATTRNNVVMCRLDDAALEAIDTLIEAGVRANRSDAAAWLIGVGLTSKAAVVDAVKDKVAEIRRIRESARALAEDAGATQ
jgi:hypothetical protein